MPYYTNFSVKGELTFRISRDDYEECPPQFLSMAATISILASRTDNYSIIVHPPDKHHINMANPIFS